MQAPVIILKLDGASIQDTERCRRIIGALFQSGVFNVRGGEAFLNFDKDGELGDIKVKDTRWTRNKDFTPLQNNLTTATIEMQSK